MKIMAPAGAADSLDAAIRAGADEVYMGISGFGARRFAKNFSVEEYCRAVDFAHRHGVSVNITLNTIMSDDEIESLFPALQTLYTAGVDAVIVQDLGFADFLRTHFPDWPRHASTQLSIAQPEEAGWARDHGFSRLVLARELSFDEIRAIREAVPQVELEVFASGALCIAASGKCLLSSFIGGRSGNRGMCTQPCRQMYKILDSSAVAPGTRREGYFLSSCDQWQDSDEIRKFLETGVEVIKLEGRMKSPEYVYTAVKFYRNLIDSFQKERVQKTDGTEEIRRLFNRGYSKGYVYEHDPDFLNPRFSASWGVPVGSVKSGIVMLSEPVRNGDGVVYLDKNLAKLGGHNVSWISLEKSDEQLAEVPAGTRVTLGEKIPPTAVWVYKTYDIALNRKIGSEMKTSRPRVAIEARITAKVGAPLELTLRCGSCVANAFSGEILQSAQKRRTTVDEFWTAFDRFGETPFTLTRECAEIELDSDAFVPRSVLNSVRQQAAATLEKMLVQTRKRAAVNIVPLERSETSGTGEVLNEPEIELSVAVTTREQAEVCAKFGISKIYPLRAPACFEKTELQTESPFTPMAASISDACRLEEKGISYALDWMFYAANRKTLRFLHDSFPYADTFFLSPEVSQSAHGELVAFAIQNGIRTGLPIYGHLYGMYTRKTLFDANFVALENQDGREVCVLKNPSPQSGSRVYLGVPLDVTASLASPHALPGLAEKRLDFTFETPQEVADILERISKSGVISSQPFSYGFLKGIF